MKQVLVIGAGASGMLAAITAARQGAAVTLLESMEKPGKKLLLTGSGRCNLTNLRQTDDCYRGADPAFIRSVLEQFPPARTREFFREIGLLTCEREGYIYPVTGQAASVLEVLLLELRRLKVKLKCQEKVRAILRTGDGFLLKTGSWEYAGQAVILSAGSQAAPSTGSDGSGYLLARQCGHTILPVQEALVPLNIREDWIQALSGVRMPATIRLHCGSFCRQASGELQWTAYGISGIAVLELSRYAVRALAEREPVRAELDLLPVLKEEELFAFLKERQQANSAQEMLAGLLPKKVIAPLLSCAGLTGAQKASSLADNALRKLAQTIKHLCLQVTGARSFAQAQACQGGVNCAELVPGTLESSKMPGLYLTGELLDVDGTCGGYNLQWAWASGYVAGRGAALEKSAGRSVSLERRGAREGKL